MTITTSQMRAARGLLDWSQSELSQRTGISTTSIGNIESGNTQARESTLEIIRKSFETGGVEFLPNSGVRLRSDFIQTYVGTQGLKDFMDSLYTTVKQTGGEIVLFNAYPENWLRILGADWFQMHADRMAELKDKITMKITSNSGETNFISNAFAEYKWFPENMFKERCLYAYGENLAFVSFEKNDVSVTVLKQDDFAKSFQILFNIAWEKVALLPNDHSVSEPEKNKK